MNRLHSDLTEFLSDNLFKTHILPKDAVKFSPLSCRFITTLFSDIMNAERAYQPSNFTPIIIDIQTDGLPKGQSYTHCPDEVKTEIESKSRSGFQYIFQINQRKFRVVLVSPYKHNKVHLYMNKAIKNIYMWLHVASQYANPACSEQMDIYIYLTGMHKLLPEKEVTISQVHANTAFTTSCKTKTEVNVFRLEEWLKTFMHETFHNMGMDFSGFDNYHINTEMYTLFPVNTDFRLYESYCEMWGETMTVLFKVYRSMRHNTRIDDIHKKIPIMIKSVENAIRCEVYHTMFQVSKILSHYGITYDELIRTNAGTNGCSYKENTPVLSYFVVKSILMFNIDYFMQWCIHNNEKSVNFTNLLENDNIHAKMKRYCNITRKHYKDPAYVDALLRVQDVFNRIKRVGRNTYLLQNLRMTITEP